MSRARTIVRENALSMRFALLFVGALVGQVASRVALLGREQVAAGLEPITLARYVTSSSFAVDVTENWQSEFLQFLVLVDLARPAARPRRVTGRARSLTRCVTGGPSDARGQGAARSCPPEIL